MKNQDKYLITKLLLGFFLATIAFNSNRLTLKSQAHTLSSVMNSRVSRPFSQVNSILITQRQTRKVKSQPKPEPEPEQKEPLDFSSLGRSGQQTAGDSRGSCVKERIPLTAIVPKSNESQTKTSHPRWWFYFPYEKSQISKIEFVIQDLKRNDLLREDVTNSLTTSYLSTTIPKTHPGIEPNRWYRWYLKTYCSSKQETVPLYVSGWVRRVVPQDRVQSLDRKLSLSTIEYIRQDLWLDAIDSLLSNSRDRSQTSNWEKTWYQIIGSSEIDLELPIPKIINSVED